MDWVFQTGGTAVPGGTPTPALDAAAGLVAGQLERHCPEAARAKIASRLAADALRQATADAGTAWATLDWERDHPVFTVRHIPQLVQLPTAPLAPEGVWAPDEYVEELSELFSEAVAVTVELPASRPPELNVSVPPVPAEAGQQTVNFVAQVATTLVRQAEAGASALEAAAAAGAGASQAALEGYVRSHDGDMPTSPAQVGQAFADFLNGAGADFFVTSSDDDHAVVVNRACPFGAAVRGQHTLCRATASLLGSLGARSAGRADVTLTESIAAGDARCRAVVRFGCDESRWSQHYVWPLADKALACGQEVGFRVSLSLQLPRDKLSVGVLRHLIGDVLEEVGVLELDRADVELAVTEAAANVIEHSGSGDAYEVALSIGPVLAELRVIDVGRGFDHVLLSETKAGPHDERGRGLALMNALVDQVRFVSAPERGTVVHLVKRLRFDDSAPARRLMLSGTESRSPGANCFGGPGHDEEQTAVD